MLWAALVHHRLLFDPSYSSACDINATVSCSEVLLSRYSSAYGVPIAILGAIWFAGALVLLGAGVFGRESQRQVLLRTRRERDGPLRRCRDPEDSRRIDARGAESRRRTGRITARGHRYRRNQQSSIDDSFGSYCQD